MPLWWIGSVHRNVEKMRCLLRFNVTLSVLTCGDNLKCRYWKYVLLFLGFTVSIEIDIVLEYYGVYMFN